MHLLLPFRAAKNASNMQGAKHHTETLATQATILFKYSVTFDHMKAPACNRNNIYTSINYKENFESDEGVLRVFLGLKLMTQYFFLLRNEIFTVTYKHAKLLIQFCTGYSFVCSCHYTGRVKM